ncbi:AbrB family transcriptional regulator [Caenispirillum bisanense]|uniref:Ammonia monooxygenase n=1 Tax=Caenispirillum bisanense TaxID=414052 RepID=A0A286GPG6_9PROT|nr:AbrB family transcriptional regulator [Caenispirillum bisanense]SOD96969.1 hypothetical protein SAMN05421508_106186 [Caenispirillum bisanense]
MSMSKALQPKQILHGLATFGLGGAGGAAAVAVAMPLPWLMGSLALTTAVSIGGARLAKLTRTRSVVLAILGVMLGSGFDVAVLGEISHWAASLAFMLALTGVMAVVSVWYCRRVAGYDLTTSLFAGVPGGLSVMSQLAAATGGDVRAVGMMHALRLCAILLLTPPAVLASGAVMPPGGFIPDELFAMPSALDMAVLTATGVGGWLGGKLLRLPNPSFMGPLLLSAVVHLGGWSAASPPAFLVVAAQIVIGAAIGARFQGVTLRVLGQYMKAAAGLVVLLLVLSGLAAWGAHLVLGIDMLAALLSYLPGGAPELGLLALTLGIDPAFVAAHHLVRLAVVVVAVPFIAQRLVARPAAVPAPGE